MGIYGEYSSIFGDPELFTIYLGPIAASKRNMTGLYVFTITAQLLIHANPPSIILLP